MQTIKVKIIYESVEGDFGTTVAFVLKKTFQFKLPIVPVSTLIIHNDAINRIPFNVTKYDPEKDIYYIRFTMNKGVNRYYHGNALEIMTPIVKEFESFGWTSERLK